MLRGEEVCVNEVRAAVLQFGDSRQAERCADLTAAAIEGRLSIWPDMLLHWRRIIIETARQHRLEGLIESVPTCLCPNGRHGRGE
jgi:hypothetical protein